MRIKTLIALLLIMLVVTSLAAAQDATVEAPTAEVTLEQIAPVAVDGATEEVTEAAAVEGDHSEDGAAEAEAAAEGEASAESETPAGSALLMLLLGVGVVAAVGGLTMLRSGNKPQ